jgi:two-component system CheB/CheR fusion protein
MKEVAVLTAPHQAVPAGRGVFFEPLTASATLKACVIGGLVQRARIEAPARVWVAGCATGEDAYSIAMLLIERCAAGGVQPNFRVFATDADEASINIARAGDYIEPALAHVSAERRRKFFHWLGTDRFQVSAALRNCVVFASHDLTVDPPLSRLDLICCRGALRAMAPQLQARVLELLHFALNEGGHLLLGAADSINPADELFEPLSVEGKLYRRLGTGPRRLSTGFIAALTHARACGSAASCRSSDVPYTGGRAGRLDAKGISAQEELQVSREELQSLNEELTVVNTELAARVDELDTAYSDMMHLMSVTNICIVFLDTTLRVTRFTSPAATLLGLKERDIARPCGAVMRGFDDELSCDARLIIEGRTVAEKNVHTRLGRCYLRRIQPHRAGSDRLGGIAVTYVDITNQLAADAQLRRFAAVLRDSEDAILVVDFAGRIKAWNRGAERLYGYTEPEALELGMRDLATGDHAEDTHEVMRRVASGEIVASFDTQRRTRDGRRLDVSATVSLLLDDAGNPESLATTERDITARRGTEEATRKLNTRLEQRVAERTL